MTFDALLVKEEERAEEGRNGKVIFLLHWTILIIPDGIPGNGGQQFQTPMLYRRIWLMRAWSGEGLYLVGGVRGGGQGCRLFGRPKADLRCGFQCTAISSHLWLTCHRSGAGQKLSIGRVDIEKMVEGRMVPCLGLFCLERAGKGHHWEACLEFWLA